VTEWKDVLGDIDLGVAYSGIKNKVIGFNVNLNKCDSKDATYNLALQ